MPKLGKATTDKKTDNGNLYFGNKDIKYVVEKSREAVEEHHNMPILYFTIDWENSHRNFYGEMLVKKFKNPKGIQVRGKYEISQGDMTYQNGVPYKIMYLIVSIYTEQLKELDIEPKPGDYFYVGQRYYKIYDATINDSGPGQILMNRQRVRADYKAYEVDDETIQKSVNEQNPGEDFFINDQAGTVLE